MHPLRIHGDHYFFCSLGPCRRLKTCPQEKKTVIFHVYYIKIKATYIHLKIVLLGEWHNTPENIAHYRPFGHVVRCFLQYLSLLSILCTSKYIYYLILHFCCQKRCENTMFLQSAIVKCIFLSRISNPICICMEVLLDYPLWNYKVESQRVTNK